MRAGRAYREGGALWLGKRGITSTVQTLVIPEGKGVVERAAQWQLSTDIYAQVGNWAAEHGQVLLSLIHSHRGEDDVWLSSTDQFYGVHVIDFLSIVVGAHGTATDPGRWGFHVFDGIEYQRLSDADVNDRIHWMDGQVTVLSATEEGVVEVA